LLLQAKDQLQKDDEAVEDHVQDLFAAFSALADPRFEGVLL
jgi:hypothetical protein